MVKDRGNAKLSYPSILNPFKELKDSGQEF